MTVELCRDRDNKAVTLRVSTDGEWQLLGLIGREGAHPLSPVIDGEGPGEFAVPADSSRHACFFFEQGRSRMRVAERLLPMSGGYNFRDLGGMPTRDGRRTAWGRLFRADGLNRLTDADLSYLDSIPVITVADFRNEHEAQRSPDRLPASVRHHAHLAITPGNLEAGRPEVLFSKPAGDDFMEEMNRALVRDPRIQARYREFFRMVQDEEYLPLLFHCSAGKDRTGLAAALILLGLGVDKDRVLADYMESERRLAGKYGHLMEKYPEQAVLFMVKPHFLQAAITAVEDDHGSVERYLTTVLGVDPDVMQKLFLE